MTDIKRCKTALIISNRLQLAKPFLSGHASLDKPSIITIESKHLLVIQSANDIYRILDFLSDHGIIRVIMLVVGKSLHADTADIWWPVRDHLNWTGENPLRGPNKDSRGPRFPDMSSPYLIEYPEKGIVCAGVKNLSLVTPAEEMMMTTLGADWLTDELVHTNILLNHAGISSTAFITDTVDSLEEKDLANFIPQNATS